MIWNIGACGTYSDYKGYTIINQSHPDLIKYEITKENDNKELIHVDLAPTIKESKRLIDILDLSDTKNILQTTNKMNSLKKLKDFQKELIENGSPAIGSKKYKEIRKKYFNL